MVRWPVAQAAKPREDERPKVNRVKTSTRSVKSALYQRATVDQGKACKVTYNAARALALLRIGCGRADATFRDDQEEAIRHVVEGRGRLLVVQKTGWGKSFVYFIATKLLRDGDSGPALLISPLLALMRNQIAAAERMGVRAATINSDNQSEWDEIEARLGRDDIDILLISPERLSNERFRTEVLAHIAAKISLLVIDEAHCISDWGHDFRPHYRLLERIVRTFPPNLRLLATTATANNRVTDDLAGVLGPKPWSSAWRSKSYFARFANHRLAQPGRAFGLVGGTARRA